MTFDDARELAQAVELRDVAAQGLQRLLHASEPEPPDALKQSMTQLANAYVDAQDHIDELLRRDDE